jgi:hypothetical protein
MPLAARVVWARSMRLFLRGSVVREWKRGGTGEGRRGWEMWEWDVRQSGIASSVGHLGGVVVAVGEVKDENRGGG